MDFQSYFDQFNSKRILVIGDVMIDAYIRGKVSRMSPEAPVPIVNLDQREDRLGGAGNVALNLAALGASPILCSVIGNDQQADLLRRLLKENSISGEGIVESSSRKTTVKTRVIGNNQQLLRVDSEQTDPITADEENELITTAKTLIETGVDAVIFEDYNKGVLTPRVIEAIVSIANQHKVITAVDPKKDNFFAYRNVTLFKPNLKELKEGLGVEFDIKTDKIAFESTVSLLETKLENTISFVTLSEHGVFICDRSTKDYVPAHVRNIADVSGAGDTVISVATLCLVVGMPIKLIAEVANLSGGLVCEVSGVIPVNKEQLLKEAIKLIV
jgi:rfaE bifunctional protein kinase chain/domain